MEKISVIVPCFNVEQYVEECLFSILHQTIGLENLEIILVDDCSEDRTMEILEKYEEQYPDNIMLVSCERNGKQGTARNIGLSYASGGYISFVDADDCISLDMYEIFMEIMEKTGSDLVEFKEFHEMGSRSDLNEKYSFQTYEIRNVEERKNLLLNSDIMGESCTKKFYRHDLLKRAEVRFAENSAYEEPLFTYPLKLWVNKIAKAEGRFYFYRCNEEGTTVKYMSRTSTILEHLEVQKQLLLFLRQTADFEIYQKELELHFLHAFFVEPFYFLKYRGVVMPSNLFQYMSRIVKQEIPEHAENPYILNGLPEEERQVLALLDELAEADEEKTVCRLQEICSFI